MENFVVSARKYRPATFDTVVGQSHITTTLKNAIKNNHLAQAFLFCGPRGVGKTTNARILAKTINCQNITADIEACDQCDSCKSFNTSSSFNIHELDAASNNSVDDIRNLVDQVRYPPQSGKYKIYIIDEVHMLSNQAFNAFLKTLEEPPSYAIFILATTEKHKIIPTILSRCQIFDFNRIQVKDIADHLAKIAEKENIKAEPQALHLIAQKADGALRDALSLFDLIVTFSSDNTVTYKTTIENLHILDYDYYFRMADFLYKQDVSQTLLTFDKILRDGFDGHNFIVGLCEHFRNLLVCKDQATVSLLEVSDEVKQKYAAQAKNISLSFLMSALNIGNSCDLSFKSSKNQRLHVELALMKMAFLNQAISLAQTTPPQAEVKKKPDPVVPAEPPATGPIPSGKGELKNTVKLPSLSKLKETVKENPSQEEKKKTESPSDVAVTEEDDRTIDREALEKLWKDYAAQMKEAGKRTEYLILDRPIELENGTSIKIKLDNLVQLDQLNTFKPDLLGFLRNSLKNRGIMLEALIAPQEDVKMIYTSSDKFKYLSEKYPLLDDMKKKFGLDTDF